MREIEFWWPGALGNETLRAALDAFERRHPEYRVVSSSEIAREAGTDPTRFLLSVAGDVPPDLILFADFAVAEMAHIGAFTDLTPFVETDRNLPGGIHEENYFSAPWNSAKHQGELYAIATGFDTRAMFYNVDPLIRADYVYRANDAEVRTGASRAGDARPPKTWEEICRKRLHARGRVSPEGTVTLRSLVRRPGVNEAEPEGAAMDLAAAGVRDGDVAVLVARGEVFRGRILEVAGEREFRFDLSRELPPSFQAVPGVFCGGECEVKVFDQDGYAVRLTRFDPETGRLTSLGFLPLYGNSWLYLFGWLNGAEFMADEGRKCNLDSVEVIGALQWLVDCYDVVGGVEEANVFLSSAQSGAALDPFVAGKVAIRIDGNWAIPFLLTYAHDLHFEVAEPPLPEKLREAGVPSLSWSGSWTYAIPSSSDEKQGAWKLLRWLMSMEALQMMARHDESFARAQGRTYVPPLSPDKRALQWYRAEYLGPDTDLPPKIVKAYNLFADLLPRSKFRPSTPAGQRLWTEHVRATEKALNHSATPYEALNYGKRQVQGALTQAFHPPTGPEINWRLSIAMLLNTKVRGLHIYRTIYYLPAIVPAVAGFILWMWIFSPSSGLINQALILLGVDHPPNWLQDPAWSKPALIIMGLWGVGGGMIIWLAGLKDIPESLYEAAAIDGANRRQRFLTITIPMLSPYILFNLIMGLIGVFQIFEAAFIMTGGGPAESTKFYAYKLFNEAFRFLNMGAASAMPWILFVIVLSITLVQLWLSKKWVYYGGE